MYQYPDYLMHYGVKGMKWGVRKQRTYDTSTAYGRMKTAKQQYKSDKKAYNKAFNNAYFHNHAYSLSKKKRQASADRWNDAIDKSRSLNSSKKAYKSAKKEYKDYKRNLNKGKSSKAKIAAGVAGGVAAAALAAYGAYKFKDFVNDTNFKYHDELGRKKVKEFTERYERLADNTYSRAQKQARDRLKSGRNTPDQYRYNITSATRINAQRHFAAGNSHYLRPDSPALLDAAERHASKVNKKKHEIWLREFKKQETDSFPQAVKNTATYYKDRKRKRR